MNYLFRRRGLGKISCAGIAYASTTGLQTVCNGIDPMPVDAAVIFRWGCTANVPHGAMALNQAKAIHLVSDKKAFRLLCQQELPEVTPRTWTDPADAAYPCIVRPQVHSQGKKLWLCKNPAELTAALGAAGPAFYISEYIPKTTEFRVMVVGGRVVWVAEKTPADAAAIAWNVAQGGRFDNVRWGDWPLGVCKAAVDAWALSGLDYGGVDVMLQVGRPYLLEINSAPSQTSPYRQLCVAKAFDWIVEHGKETLACEPARGWQGLVHPAVAAR